MACCRNIHLFILHIGFECDLWLDVRQLKWCHSTVTLHWHRRSFFFSAEKTKQRTTLTSTMGWKKDRARSWHGHVPPRSISLSYTQRNKHQVHPHLFRQYPKTFTLTRRPTDMLPVESFRKIKCYRTKNCLLMHLNQKWIFAPSDSHRCDHTQQSYKYSHS